MMFFLLLADLVVSIPIGQTIGFQAHSYNDVAEWRSVFAKGTGHLKIDPQFKDRSFCSKQSRDRTADPRGCFVLNHDPVFSQNRSDYNTGDDVLAFLSDPANSLFLASPVQLQLALCFKAASVHACNDTNWLGLTDTWIQDLQRVIAARRLNVQLVLDGHASPTASRPCLWNRWRPLNSTWQPPGDPPGAFFSDKCNACDRYQVLDLPAYEGPIGSQIFQAAALVGYGKFAKSAYDFFVWEPSSSAAIRNVLGVYNKTGIVHRNMRMAINIDPVQYELYAAPISGTATDQVVSPWIAPSKPAQVLTAAMGSLVVLFRSNGRGSVDVTVLSDSQRAYSFSQVAAMSLNLTGTMVSASCVTDVCWLTDSTTAFALFAPLNGTVLLQSSGFHSAATLLESASGTLLVVTAGWNLRCKLEVTVLTLPLRASGGGCFPTNNPKDVATISIAAAFNQSNSIVGLLSFDDSAGNVFFTTFTASFASGSWDVEASTANDLTSVGVGSRPSVAVAFSPALNDTVAVLVHTDGYCWNAEVYNKRPAPALCQSTPQSTAGVASYAYGRWSTFEARTLSGDALSPCDAELLHGSFGQSLLPPTVALLPTDPKRKPLPTHPCGPICVDPSLRVAVGAVGGAAAPPNCGADSTGASGDALLKVWAPPTLL
jgi:hypothetical protein